MKASTNLVDQGGCAACEAATPTVNSFGEPPPTGPSVIQRDEADSNWIVIEVVGEDGTPLGGETFRLVLSDGGVIEGRLDRRGRVRVEGVGADDVSVTLPGRDRADWDREASGS